MRAAIENWSIVMVGHWNAMIITPDWLTRTLLEEGQRVDVEFPVENPLLPVRFTCNGVRIVVRPQRIDLSPTQDRRDVLERMERFATIILRTLQHTPVLSIGVNFLFTTEQRPPLVHPEQDIPQLAAANWVVDATEHKRRLRRQDIIMIFALQQALGQPVIFNFNFHRDVHGALAAAEYLEGRVIACREMALEFLHRIYELELEGEEA